jgi:hypothetical protein
MTALLERLVSFTGLPSLILVVAALAFALGGFSGGQTVAWQKNAEIASLQKDYAEARAEAEKAIADALQKVLEVERQGDAIAARLAAAEAERITISKEKDREIARLTTGRRCLDAGVVRLLNAPASGPGLKLPPASGGIAFAAAAPATDTAYASDTDIALWTRHARDSYDTCRARIDALNEFYKATESP